jgi:hypothetical protein
MLRSPLFHCLIANIAGVTQRCIASGLAHVLRRELADRHVLDRHDLQGDWDSTRARRSYSPSSIAPHALPTIRALVSPSRSHTKASNFRPVQAAERAWQSWPLSGCMRKWRIVRSSRRLLIPLNGASAVMPPRPSFNAPIPRQVQGAGRTFAKPHLGGLHPRYVRI